MHGTLGLADGKRRIAGDHARCFKCCGQHLLWRADAVQNAPFKRLFRGEGLAGQDDFLGAAFADNARQGLRAAGAWHDANRHFRQRKARARHAIGKV